MAWQFRNDIPIYTQLIAQIQQRIVSGALLPGERLPSVRDLAAEAGVNPNTMQRAMMEMEREELVYSQRTAGRFVTEDGERIRRLRESLARNQVRECTSWGSSWERSSHLYRRKERRDTMSILECKGLSKRFGAVTALDGISFTIEPGRIVGLLGPNGSGKTTLIKLANGLLVPTAGELWINGRAPGKESHAMVSYLPERTSLPLWMTVKQLQDFYEDFYADFQRERSEEMLDRLEISAKQRMKHMSKGTREKVQLILAMSRQAKLYLLDEPIGGVDPAARDYILDTIIRNYNPEASVIISTHLIADVEKVLDEVLFIDRGQILLQSSVDAIREEKGMSVDALFREVYKC